MPEHNHSKKGTDRDVRPTRGQESNENWDDANDKRSSDTSAGKKSDSGRTDEETKTSGDSSTEQLPSRKQPDKGNATGPGLG